MIGLEFEKNGQASEASDSPFYLSLVPLHCFQSALLLVRQSRLFLSVLPVIHLASSVIHLSHVISG